MDKIEVAKAKNDNNKNRAGACTAHSSNNGK